MRRTVRWALILSILPALHSLEDALFRTTTVEKLDPFLGPALRAAIVILVLIFGIRAVSSVERE